MALGASAGRDVLARYCRAQTRSQPPPRRLDRSVWTGSASALLGWMRAVDGGRSALGGDLTGATLGPRSSPGEVGARVASAVSSSAVAPALTAWDGGLVLVVLVGLVARWLPGPRAAPVAVVVSGLAFGVGHLGNLGYVPTSFVLVQAVAATVFGLLAGWVRLRTDSLAGPVLFHAAMNTAAVL